MANVGEKVLFKGVEHTVLKIYEQTMVQIIDTNDHVRSAPFVQVVRETMAALGDQDEDTPND